VGERVMNPTFGCNLKRFLFEGITNDNSDLIVESISNSISIFVPEITVTNITIVPNSDYNLIDLTIDYVLNISQAPDQVTVQFT
jgi:phage baseplate assembly protein W